MPLRITTLALFILVSSGCYISESADAGPACVASTCGCYTKTHMIFTGQVMDAYSGQCIKGKLVRLRDRDGTVRAEDTSRTPGTYRLEGDVDRSPNCVGGEPVIRDDPDMGQTLPTYGYLPRRTPTTTAGSEQVDLLRVPYGTNDAGTTTPALCTPPPATDAGP